MRARISAASFSSLHGSGREDDLRPRPLLAAQLEAAVQLVTNQRSNDREARAARRLREATPVVGDRQQCVAVPGRQLDPHLVAAVLERVLEQLAEDECQRSGAIAGKGDGFEL